MKEKKKIIVLGAGLVGSAIVRDLAQERLFQVTAVDRERANLARLASMAPIHTRLADLSAPGAVEAIVTDSDLVVSAVPGFMGFDLLRRIIAAGKNVVDISFFGEDPFLLDDIARKKGVTAVVDCGVAPGLSNIIGGHTTTQLDQAESYVCYVGGLPVVRRWPYAYQSVFSPVDVIEEYTRPARLVECGREVVRPALSEVERVEFPQIGTLEAFNSDGLRTMIRTLDMPFMKEKTLRYPGHAELMRVFRESGFFRTDPVAINGHAVRPIDLTAKLLFDQWQRQEDEEDFLVMRVIVEGRRGDQRVRINYDLLDRYDPATGTTAMARTTGYTCAIVARQVLAGLFTRKGIAPPEFVGQSSACYDHLLTEYAKRNIQLREVVSEQVG